MSLLAWHACVLPVASARAETPASPNTTEASSREEALALFEESEKAFRSGRYLESAALLERAFTLTPEPVLLYNLGIAYEAARVPARAVEAYERYLDLGRDVHDAPKIRERIASLRALSAKTPPEPVPAVPDATLRRNPTDVPPAIVAAAETPAPRPRSVWPTAAALAAVGAGVTLLYSSYTFASRAQERHAIAVSERNARKAEAEQEDAKRLASVATATGAGGAALCAAGLGLYLVELAWSSPPRDETSAFFIGVRSVGVRLSF